MSEIVVSAPKVNRDVKFDKDFGATTAEKVELYTEEVCNSCLDAIFAIKCQAVVRAKLVAVNAEGIPVNTDEHAIAAGLAYVPQKAVRGKKKDPIMLLAEDVASGKISKRDLMKAIEAKLAVIESGASAEGA